MSKCGPYTDFDDEEEYEEDEEEYEEDEEEYEEDEEKDIFTKNYADWEKLYYEYREKPVEVDGKLYHYSCSHYVSFGKESNRAEIISDPCSVCDEPLDQLGETIEEKRKIYNIRSNKAYDKWLEYKEKAKQEQWEAHAEDRANYKGLGKEERLKQFIERLERNGCYDISHDDHGDRVNIRASVPSRSLDYYYGPRVYYTMTQRLKGGWRVASASNRMPPLK